MNSRLLKPALLRWQLRQLLPINACMFVVTVLYTLGRFGPIVAPGDFGLLLGVIAHSGVVVWQLGRGTSRATGFLHTQGYSRNEMWFQMMVASAFSAFVVCGSMWLIMVTGLRAGLQDVLIQNPWFPFMRTAEYAVPGILLLEYATVLLLIHYAWIRANQSAKDSSGGWMLMCLGICFLLWGFGMSWSHRWHPWILDAMPILFIPSLLVTLIAGFRLHRTTEVRS